MRSVRWFASAVLVAACLLAVPALHAQEEPVRGPIFVDKTVRHADLEISMIHDELDRLPASAATEARQRLQRLGVEMSTARIDRRGGRFATLTVERSVGSGAAVEQ